MKRLFFTVILFTGFFTTVEAQQIADNAIGIRVGDNNGFGTEINYQRAISENNRLEFGLGWNSSSKANGFKLTGIYQWVWNIDGDFNWYAGAGGGVGSSKSNSFIFVAGDIGIEYDFDIPLLISLDIRPEIGFGNYRNDLGFDIGLGLRYQF